METRRSKRKVNSVADSSAASSAQGVKKRTRQSVRLTRFALEASEKTEGKVEYRSSRASLKQSGPEAAPAEAVPSSLPELSNQTLQAPGPSSSAPPRAATRQRNSSEDKNSSGSKSAPETLAERMDTGSRQRRGASSNDAATGSGGQSDKDPVSERFGRDISGSSSALHGILKKLGAGFDEILLTGSCGSRLKGIIAGLKQSDNESQQITALTELCEVLSISTEESLSSFPVEQVVPSLVQSLNSDINPDATLLAARALTFLADVLPSSCGAIVRHGAVPAFCARLLTVEYIDLAEQSLQALEKLSHEHPQDLLRNGGLVAVLSYLDFFPTGVQRVAVATAANMCHGVTAEHAQAVTEAVPMLTTLLEYQDAKVVDGACLALTYIARAFSNKPALLEVLTSNGLISRATQLINVSGTGSMTSQLSVTTFFGLIKLLATCAAGSPSVAQHLLQAGISDVLKTLIATSSVLACGPAPAAVLRSPDQLFEVVCLAHELLPGMPDSRAVVQQDLPALAPAAAGESTELCKFLEENPDVLKQLTADLMPLLLQVFASSVLPQVRHQVLSSIVKLLYFSTPSILEEVLTDLPISSFICNLLNSQNSVAAAFALHMAELLMEKVPDAYRTLFLKEGVLHAIDLVSAPASKGIDIPRRGAVTRARKAAAEQAAAAAAAAAEAAAAEEKAKAAAAAAGTDSAAALRTAIAQRAFKFKAKYFDQSGGLSLDTDGMRTLKRLCSKLHKDGNALKQLCDFVTNPINNVSVFELLGSGMVKHLHSFLTGADLACNTADRDDTILRRMASFVEVAMPTNASADRPALLELVRKMQQALASAENFPVLCSHVSTTPSFSSGGGSSGFFMGLGMSPGGPTGSGRPPMPTTGSGSFSSSSSLSSSLSSGLAALAHPFKLRLMRHSKETKLKEYPPNIVLIEPLASLAALEEFLLPKVTGPGGPSASSGSKPSSPMPAGTNAPFAGASKSHSINIPPAAGSTPASTVSSPPENAAAKGRKAASFDECGSMRLTHTAVAAANSTSQVATGAAAAAEAAATAAGSLGRVGRSTLSHPLVGPSSRAGNSNRTSNNATKNAAGNSSPDEAGSAEAMSEDEDGEVMVLRHMSTASQQDAGDVDMDDDTREEGVFEDEDDQDMHMEDAQHDEEEEEDDDDDDDDDDDHDDGDEDDEGRHVSADDAHAPSLRVHDLHVARCPSRPSARSLLQQNLEEQPPQTTASQPPWRSNHPTTMSHAAVASKPAGKLSFYLKGTRLSSNMTVFQAIQQSHYNSQIAQQDDPDSTPAPPRGRRLWDEIYTFNYCLSTSDVESSQSPAAAAANTTSSTPTASLPAVQDFAPLRELLSLKLPSDLQASPACLEVLQLLQLLDAVNRLSPWLTAYSDVLAHSVAVQERIKSNSSSSSSEACDETGTGARVLAMGRAPVAQSEFVSAKLGSKLSQQLKDVLSICGGGMPPWCRRLVFSCRMLFPFEVRRQYFYCTAFGLGRALQYIQQLHSSEGGGPLPNDREARELRIGRLHRQKVRVSRKRILESAMKVMEMYAKQKAVLELEYFGEVGTGLGPTLEFYTLLSHELQRHSLGLWRSQDPPRVGSVAGVHTPGDEATADANDSASVLYVNAPNGLFPAPWHESQTAHKTKVLECFRLLGRTVGKALQDSRLVDLPLSSVFYKLVLGREVDIYDVCAFDPSLGATLLKLKAALHTWKAAGQKGSLFVDGARIDDLCLDFTLPGYPEYILRPGGSDITITDLNLQEYLNAVVSATLKEGIVDQVAAFREGFNEVFKLEALGCFSELEIDIMLCGAGEKWAVPMLAESIKFDHGYNANSQVVHYFLEILSELDSADQRRFLRFVTGCPRLPAGGVAALQPRLTVVRKAPSGDTGITPGTTPTSSSLKEVITTAADCDLPSVMTCANYIKLPPYSTKKVMLERLLYAIREGQGSFDLS